VAYDRAMGNRPSHHEVVSATTHLSDTMTPQRVPVNAYEAPGAFVIVAPLPAVTADDVTIELTDGQVRFWADLRSAGPREFAIHEWEYGGYERTVPVPAGYGSAVEASLANGQLVVRVLDGEFTVRKRVQPSPNIQ